LLRCRCAGPWRGLSRRGLGRRSERARTVRPFRTVRTFHTIRSAAALGTIRQVRSLRPVRSLARSAAYWRRRNCGCAWRRVGCAGPGCGIHGPWACASRARGPLAPEPVFRHRSFTPPLAARLLGRIGRASGTPLAARALVTGPELCAAGRPLRAALSARPLFAPPNIEATLRPNPRGSFGRARLRDCEMRSGPFSRQREPTRQERYRG